MNQITNLFGEPYDNKSKRKPVDKVRRNWQARFQRWSDKNSMDGMTSRGKCGYGSMCDYCTNNHYGNPCVRALNCMLKEKGLTIDYQSADFYDVWDGEYFKGK